MWCHLAHGLGVGTCKTCSACRPCIWCPPRATNEPHTQHNVPMIPKPLQFLLLAPLAFGPMAPRFVAIAEAVAERLKGRHGSNQFKAQGGGNISTSLDDAGKTRDLAAAKAGLGSGKTPVLPVLLCDRQRGL